MKTAHSIPQQTALVESDFSQFNPRAYLDEYHCDWDDEDEFLMSFLHEVYRDLEPQRTLLEIGGGPTIHQLISARNKVETIVFGEYLKKNRIEVKGWREGRKRAFSWDPYFEHVLKLEGGSHEQTISEMKKTLRQKFRFIVPCNILEARPMPFMPVRNFDLVSVHFCPESITSQESEFLAGMRRVIAMAKPEGLLIMSFLKESSMYAVGKTNFCAYPLTEAKLKQTLAALGCEILQLAHGPADPTRNYYGTISLVAQRRAASGLRAV